MTGIATGDPQRDAIRLLARTATHPAMAPGARVERIDTHCAHLFVAGDDVYKMKRAVRFSYLDQSTPDLRERLCRRELELNRPGLPGIYLGVMPIGRAPDGELALGDAGDPVEWVLHMRRFDPELVLDRVVERGELDTTLARALGDSVARYHAGLPPVIVDDGAERVHEVVEELAQALGVDASTDPGAPEARFAAAARAALARLRPLLDERGRTGRVRRCHGDLHLRNLVIHDGVPTPFDALEFDERMATTDTLYDLAFLLMDLLHRGEITCANLVLNAWLPHVDEAGLAGLAALPLFTAVRAGIRAMTSRQAAALDPGGAGAAAIEGEAYLRLALDSLTPSPPRLVCVGGLSGSGKSTLAQALAPSLHSGAGAVLLRSDVERKVAAGVAATVRLSPDAYTPDASRSNHDRLARRARAALLAGRSAVVDAVFLAAAERRAIETVARELGVPFDGLWLEASPATLEARLADRTGDASDADAVVMRRQLGMHEPPDDWTRVDAGGTRRHALANARTGLLA